MELHKHVRADLHTHEKSQLRPAEPASLAKSRLANLQKISDAFMSLPQPKRNGPPTDIYSHCSHI